MSFFMRDKKESASEPVAPPVRLSSTPAAPVAPIAPVVVAEPPTLSAEGTLDFPAIYQFAKVSDTSFTAEQTLDMLEKLPKEMPLEMKRQTVQVTLGALGTAIGANRQSIVGDATQKRDTLQQFAEAQGKKNADYVSETESQIADLQRQIAEKEEQIATAKEKQERIHTLCDTESDRLESVLSFFGTEPAPTLSVTPVVSLILDDKESDTEDAPVEFKAAA
jgi:hypothetical protein